MIAQFSLRLICGMSLMWCLMPRSRVASGFFRIQMLVVLGLSVLAALTLGSLSGGAQGAAPLLTANVALAICLSLTAAAFLGSVFWTLERRRAGSIFGFLIAAASTVLLLFWQPPLGPVWGSAEPLRLMSEVSSASLLGSTTAAMLLGHWHLTAPTMSIEPLKRLTGYLGAAGLIRLILSTVGLALARDQISGNTYWLWLALRWSAGIAGPLLVFLMVWRILKYRNTQAATGVLFVGVILTFLGEMTGSLLYRELATPL